MDKITAAVFLGGEGGDISFIKDRLLKGATIICADSGAELALSARVKPDYLIGDMDSISLDILEKTDCEIIVFDEKKALTDAALAFDFAIEHGAKKIIVFGGIGGRMDHFLALLQDMARICESGTEIILENSDCMIRMITGEAVAEFEQMEAYYFSVFAMSEKVSGLDLCGFEYPLANFELSRTSPIGLSNRWTEKTGTVRIKSGTLALLIVKK